ncbi:MAG: type I-E CRISPR-associated protein Cse1/CasA, partial [Candidatus Bipolaricaulia bacterium]
QVGSLRPDGDVSKYLTAQHGRFFLFNGTSPFMQVAGLDLSEYRADGTVLRDKTDGLMRLAREAPDKGGRVLFDHRVGTEKPDYEPRKIARMILAAQSYAGTGVASSGTIEEQQIKPSPCQFAPCVDGLVLWLQGDNLFQTLTLNLVPRDVNAHDLPTWEDDRVISSAIDSWTASVGFAGPVQRFAPLSRFVRVLDNRTMFFTNGLKATRDSDDPMKAYYRKSDAEPYVALELNEDKAAWRDAHTLLAVDTANRKPPASLNFAARLERDGTIRAGVRFRANVVGLATKQGSCLLWRHERMPVPAALLSNVDLVEQLGILLNEAEAAGTRLSAGLFWSSKLKRTVRSEPVGRAQQIADLFISPALAVQAEGRSRREDGRAPDDAHNKAALDLSKHLDPRPAYWARLERHFFDLVENLPGDWDAATGGWKPDDQQVATRTWREHVKREARQALEESIRALGTTARAVQAVGRVRTDFNDGDLKPMARKTTKVKEKGGKRSE